MDKPMPQDTNENKRNTNKDEPEPMECNSLDSETEFPKPYPLIKLSGKIADNETILVLDTGASCTMIADKFVQKHGIPYQLLASSVT